MNTPNSIPRSLETRAEMPNGFIGSMKVRPDLFIPPTEPQQRIEPPRKEAVILDLTKVAYAVEGYGALVTGLRFRPPKPKEDKED